MGGALYSFTTGTVLKRTDRERREDDRREGRTLLHTALRTRTTVGRLSNSTLCLYCIRTVHAIKYCTVYVRVILERMDGLKGGEDE